MTARRASLERAQLDAKVVRVQRIIASFPSELLRAIFLSVAHTARRRGAAWGKVTRKFKNTPLMLAAVNRQWRRAALEAAGLWALIVLPAFEDRDGPMFLAHTELMLQRSRRHPLRVFLSWGSAKFEDSECYGKIVSTLSRHALRWLQLSISIPAESPEDFWRIFRLPTPIQEDLYLVHTHDSVINSDTSMPEAANSPHYLRLRRLHNHATVFFSVPREPLRHLVDIDLSIGASVDTAAVWAFLCAAPSVERLQLSFQQEEDPPTNAPSAPHEPLTFPHLFLLGIYGSHSRFTAHLACMRMPRLARVAVTNLEVLPLLTTASDSIAGTATMLAICELGAECEGLQHLRALPKVRSVVFRGCTFVGANVPAAFASRAAAGLPHLEHIVFDSPRLDDEQAAHLSVLVQALHAAAATAQGTALSVELSFTGKKDGVPQWLIQQHAFFYGQRASACKAG